LWRFETGDAVWGSPVVADGVVYIGSYDRHLYALDAESGELEWRFELEDRMDGTPAVVDGVVYFGSFDKRVYAVDAMTGEKIWSFWTGGIVRSSPTVIGDVVFVGSHCRTNECQHYYDERFAKIGFVFALDAESGDLLWEYESGDEIISSPAYADETVYIGSVDQHVHAIDALTGRKEWVVDTGDLVQSSPAVVGEWVYVTNRNGDIIGIDAVNGEIQWEYGTDSNMFVASPAVDDTALYAGNQKNLENGESAFYGIDRRSGEELWSAVLPGQLKGSSPALASQKLFFGTHNLHEDADGEPGLFCVDTDGNECWRITTEDGVFGGGLGIGSSPAVTAGFGRTLLYVGGTDGDVYCFDLSE
jgi:outer membrane protein assembly factor BamB